MGELDARIYLRRHSELICNNDARAGTSKWINLGFLAVDDSQIKRPEPSDRIRHKKMVRGDKSVVYLLGILSSKVEIPG
jgi:hypothetical protein